MRHERLVLDTSVLISAALQPKGKPAAALRFAFEHSSLIFSKESFAEIATRLMRAKFDAAISRTARSEFLQDLYEAVEWVAIRGAPQGCRDPKDDMFLETAFNGRAGVLVTSDGDLLALRPGSGSDIVTSWDSGFFRGLAIVRPAEFLTLAIAELQAGRETR